MLLKSGFLICTLHFDIKFDSFSQANVFALECRFPMSTGSEKRLRYQILDAFSEKTFRGL